jgi:hypothetical protein
MDPAKKMQVARCVVICMPACIIGMVGKQESV